MRIAFIIHPRQIIRLPFDADGSIPNMMYQHAVRLGQAGHEVIIYARRAHNREASEEPAARNVTIRRLAPTYEELLHNPIDFIERLRGIGEEKRPFFASSYYYMGFARQVASDLERLEPDVVLVNNFSQFVTVIRDRLPDCRIVLYMHCDWLDQIERDVIGPRLQDADLILGASGHVTRAVQRRFPRLAGRCKTLYCGVDTDHFVPSVNSDRTEKRILYVGRISPEKGIHVLMDAFKLVLKRLPAARLDVVGSARLLASTFIVELSSDPRVQSLLTFYGTNASSRARRLLTQRRRGYLDDIRARLSKGEARQVTFHGNIPHSGLPSMYHGASVLVNCSLSETFGVPISEGMASGIPCVGSRIGGVPEVIEDGVTGLIAEPADPESVARALCEVLESDERADNMGREGRKRAVSQFSWDVLGDTLHMYLESITAAPHERGDGFSDNYLPTVGSHHA